MKRDYMVIITNNADEELVNKYVKIYGKQTGQNLCNDEIIRYSSKSELRKYLNDIDFDNVHTILIDPFLMLSDFPVDEICLLALDKGIQVKDLSLEIDFTEIRKKMDISTLRDELQHEYDRKENKRTKGIFRNHDPISIRSNKALIVFTDCGDRSLIEKSIVFCERNNFEHIGYEVVSNIANFKDEILECLDEHNAGVLLVQDPSEVITEYEFIKKLETKHIEVIDVTLGLSITDHYKEDNITLMLVHEPADIEAMIPYVQENGINCNTGMNINDSETDKRLLIKRIVDHAKDTHVANLLIKDRYALGLSDCEMNDFIELLNDHNIRIYAPNEGELKVKISQNFIQSMN